MQQTKLLFDIRRSSDLYNKSSFIPQYANFASPYNQHHIEIDDAYFNNKDKTPFRPPHIHGNAYVRSEPVNVFKGIKKTINKVEINGNSCTIYTEGKTVKITFCDENNYNILRIGDEIKSLENEITFLINGDYCYLGGSVLERCLSLFQKLISSEDNSFSILCGSTVNHRTDEIQTKWKKFRSIVLNELNARCVSSEESMFFYTDLYDIFKALCLDFLYQRSPSKEGMKNPGTEHPAVTARNIFCGTKDFSSKDYEKVVENYPLLWKPEVSQWFIDNQCLFVGNMTVHTGYKFELLEQPWNANAVYAVGPMWYDRDYDDNNQRFLFLENYNELIKNIFTYDFTDEMEKKKIFVTSIIGGRFQIQKNFNVAKNHSDQKIKNMILLSKQESILNIPNHNMEQMAIDWIPLIFELLGDDDDKMTKFSKSKLFGKELCNLASGKLNELSEKFSSEMREKMVSSFVNSAVIGKYDEIYISVPPGEYDIFGKKLIVNHLDGPNGTGSKF